MAGCGGSAYGDYVGRGSATGGPSCSLLTYDTPVSSPVPASVATPPVGTVCEVLLESARRSCACMSGTPVNDA